MANFADLVPTPFPYPFRHASGPDAGLINAIPEGSAPPAASFEDGFPLITMIDSELGGVPPSGGDMNGVLNLLTQQQVYNQFGGRPRYSSAFSTARAGYPKDVVLQDASDPSLEWRSLLDGNLRDSTRFQASGSLSGTTLTISAVSEDILPDFEIITPWLSFPARVVAQITGTPHRAGTYTIEPAEGEILEDFSATSQIQVSAWTQNNLRFLDVRKDRVTVLDYMTATQRESALAGDYVEDCTDAVQMAYSRGRCIDWVSSKVKVKLTATIRINDNTEVLGRSASVQMFTAQTPMFESVSATPNNIKVFRLNHIGYSADYVNTAGSLARCYNIDQITVFVVEDCSFVGFSHAGLRITDCSYVWINRNFFYIDAGGSSINYLFGLAITGQFIWVTNNVFQGGYSGIVAGPSGNISNAWIKGNYIAGGYLAGVFLAALADEFNVYDNTIELNTYNGIFLKSFDAHLTRQGVINIHSNEILHNGAQAVYAGLESVASLGFSVLNIENNNLLDDIGYAIETHKIGNLLIKGNKVTVGTGAGSGVYGREIISGIIENNNFLVKEICMDVIGTSLRIKNNTLYVLGAGTTSIGITVTYEHIIDLNSNDIDMASNLINNFGIILNQSGPQYYANFVHNNTVYGLAGHGTSFTNNDLHPLKLDVGNYYE
jgi:hypothetical protein